MPKWSTIFSPGERVPNSFLTVIGPVIQDRWNLIRCSCECGNTITVTYAQLYQGKYSCGCIRRGERPRSRECGPLPEDLPIKRAFVPGEYLSGGSMLRVVGRGPGGTWREVVCICDCGATVNVPYAQAYNGRFSCGCQLRLHVDSADHSGVDVRNGAGNNKDGRRLTVLCRDPETQRWLYLCHCCGDIFVVPRGQERGMLRTMEDIAGQICPNWRGRWTSVDRIDIFDGWVDLETGERCEYVDPHGAWVWPKELWPGDGTRPMAVALLAPYYQPRCIARNAKGEIQGVFGWPAQTVINEDELAKWTPHMHQRQAEFTAKQKAKAAGAVDINTPMAADLDGFGADALESPVSGYDG